MISLHTFWGEFLYEIKNFFRIRAVVYNIPYEEDFIEGSLIKNSSECLNIGVYV